jgi:hypothetical protein
MSISSLTIWPRLADHRPGNSKPCIKKEGFMGNLQAGEMARLNKDLHSSITWQLRSNHYPPVPYEMVKVAVEAVKLARAGDFDSTIKTPFEHIEHGYQVPVRVIIESYRLWPWLYEGEEGDG